VSTNHCAISKESTYAGGTACATKTKFCAFDTHHGGSRAIILAIQRQPGTNTIEATDGVKSPSKM
jgi:hypothetical protein